MLESFEIVVYLPDSTTCCVGMDLQIPNIGFVGFLFVLPMVEVTR